MQDHQSRWERLLQDIDDEINRAEPADADVWAEARAINELSGRYLESFLRREIPEDEFLRRIAEVQERARPEAFALATRLNRIKTRLQMWRADDSEDQPHDDDHYRPGPAPDPG